MKSFKHRIGASKGGVALLQKELPNDPFLKIFEELILELRTFEELSINSRDVQIGVIWIGEPWSKSNLIKYAAKNPRTIARALTTPKLFLDSLLAFLWRPPGFGHPNELLYMAVSSESQSQGIGSALVHESELRGLLKSGAWVNTLASSHSKSFYINNGFSLVSERYGRSVLRYE